MLGKSETISRMKPIKCLVFSMAVFGAIFSNSAVSAQGIVLQNGYSQVSAIKRSCDSIQTVIRRLHTSDSLARVNYGQVYNDISSDLMAKLNSRMALNKIDATELINITNKFEDYRTLFSEDYNKYEKEISSLLKIDCKKDPAQYYRYLVSSRELRTQLASSVVRLNSTVADYRVAVEKLLQETSR